MMVTRDQIVEQALALPPEDRAFLVAALTESLTQESAPSAEKPPTDAMLLAELQRRSSAYRAGSTTAKALDEVLETLRERQAKSRNA